MYQSPVGRFTRFGFSKNKGRFRGRNFIHSFWKFNSPFRNFPVAEDYFPESFFGNGLSRDKDFFSLGPPFLDFFVGTQKRGDQMPEEELYQVDNKDKAWKWIKMYYLNVNADSAELKKYLESTEDPGTPPDPKKGGLKWWLETHDKLDVPQPPPIEAHFWEASFVPEGGVGMVRVLLILLNSKGDPWEGTPAKGVPEIPRFDEFFVRPVKGETHLAFEMTPITGWPPIPPQGGIPASAPDSN